MRQHGIWNSRYTNSGPIYNSRWTGMGGSPKWKLPPLPLGALFPPERYSIGHFWQFSESAQLPQSYLTCEGKPADRTLDMDWIPVGGDEYPWVFDPKNRP